MEITGSENKKQDALISGLVSQAQQIASEETTVEIAEETAPTTPEQVKSASFSKNLINILIIAIFIIGVGGSFLDKTTWFSMDAYLAFIEKFAIVFVPLLIMVGSGRAFKNFVSKKYKE